MTSFQSRMAMGAALSVLALAMATPAAHAQQTTAAVGGVAVDDKGAPVGGATITLLPIGLKPGAYHVNWRAVGHDTHKLSVSFGFKVVP